MLIYFTASTMKTKSFNHQYSSISTVSNGNTSDDSSSNSPPPSPRRPQHQLQPNHLSLSQSRRRLRSKSFTLQQQSRRDNLFAGLFHPRYLLILPLLYISGLLLFVGPLSALLAQSPAPGSVYRSNEFFVKLWPHLQSDNFSAIELSSVWKQKRKPKEQKPCQTTTGRQLFESPGFSGYLVVDANGGLNQQRSSICNAVALAGILNAVLVIPRFEFHNVWRDTSEFGDIYDVDHFIATLKGHVEVVRELPKEIMETYDNDVSNIPSIRVQAWASVNYYLGEVYPLIIKQGVIRISPFANRLAMNVPPHIQFLRCLANYEALKFSSSISTLARTLVKRMTINGKYISIHLRFEEDMVAFSCCVYDGSKAEKSEMDSIREKGWKEKFKRKGRIINPGLNRLNGKCPLTPLEVGMMLRGMGFDNTTSIYLASGKIYQGNRYLAPLQMMFPLLHTKESLATPDELAPFEGYSSRLAALDYLVCLYSEAFVTTQGGNFPHLLMGHRRFLYDGHAKTIKPNKPKLVHFLQDMSISWKDFKDEMKAMLIESDREGIMVPRTRKSTKRASIYTFPLPDCRCLQKPQNSSSHTLDYSTSSLLKTNLIL